MAQKRLFVGTILPPKILGQHTEELKGIFGDVCRGKWVEDYNAHLNFKFLGNVDEERIPEIKEALSSVLRKHNQPLYINNLSCFPSLKRPKVLYSKIYSPGKFVHKLYSKIERTLTQDLGFPREKGKFTPHVTICRLKETDDNFLKVLEENEEYKIGFLKFFRINLIASTLSNDGPTYEIL